MSIQVPYVCIHLELPGNTNQLEVPRQGCGNIDGHAGPCCPRVLRSRHITLTCCGLHNTIPQAISGLPPISALAFKSPESPIHTFGNPAVRLRLPHNQTSLQGDYRVFSRQISAHGMLKCNLRKRVDAQRWFGCSTLFTMQTAWQEGRALREPRPSPVIHQTNS
jgi:hypothetical protein